MADNDYASLSDEELVKRAELLEKAFDEDEEYDALSTAFYDLHEKMFLKAPRPSNDLSDNMKKLRAETKALMRELERRYDEGRVPVRDLMSAAGRIPDEKNRARHYIIEVEVSDNGDFSYKWNLWKGEPKGHLYWKDEDAEKGIPDGKLLEKAPHEWLVRQLHSGKYLEFEGVYDDEFEDIHEKDPD